MHSTQLQCACDSRRLLTMWRGPHAPRDPTYVPALSATHPSEGMRHAVSKRRDQLKKAKIHLSCKKMEGINVFVFAEQNTRRRGKK